MNKRINKDHLSIAITTAEPQVSVPSRSKAGSMKSQIEALDVGDIASKLEAVDENLILLDYIHKAPEMRERLRNSLTSTVAKAKELTGGTYTIEVGEMVLRNKLYLVAVITRTA